MERGYTLEELWAAARRRARPVLFVFAAALVAGAVVVASLPDEYRAEATIILEPYRPHAELVTPAVTTLLEDRLRVARQQLLAGPLLEKVATEFQLYRKERERGGPAAQVAALRAALEVHPDGESAIVVAYRTAEREKAALVVEAIARGFVEANASLRTGQAQRVLDILGEELGQVSTQLDEQERKVRGFRLAHDGELPEQVEANMREAERTTRLLDSTFGYIRDLERRRALAPRHETSPEVDRLTAIESDLVRQLNHARTVYSDDHPEPVRLSRELEGLRAEKAVALGRVDTLERERESIARELTRAKADAADLEKRIKTARDRAVAAAKWGAELSVLERDRDLLREKYRSLLSRKVEGEVSLGLEQKSAAHATHVVNPPAAPSGPSAPDRVRLLLVVLALAAGLAIGTGVLLESRDATMRSPAQARTQLDVPLLAVLPSVRK